MPKTNNPNLADMFEMNGNNNLVTIVADCPKGAKDNKYTLVVVMVWHQIGNRTLAEPMMTQFY